MTFFFLEIWFKAHNCYKTPNITWIESVALHPLQWVLNTNSNHQSERRSVLAAPWNYSPLQSIPIDHLFLKHALSVLQCMTRSAVWQKSHDVQWTCSPSVPTAKDEMKSENTRALKSVSSKYSDLISMELKQTEATLKAACLKSRGPIKLFTQPHLDHRTNGFTVHLEEYQFWGAFKFKLL